MGIQIDNPLGTQKVSSLLHRFALPSIVAMLVSSLYNIVDQFFIGHSVGELGNAATNISFPLSISCVAIALLFGIGGSSAFNISMGLGQTIAEEKKKAVYFMGNALFMMVFCGTVLLAVTQLFLQQLMVFFGSSREVLGYASVYTRIVSIGFPFVIVAGRWPTKAYNAVQSGWRSDQYGIRCIICIWFSMGHGRSSMGNGHWTDDLRRFGGLFFVPLPYGYIVS